MTQNNGSWDVKALKNLNPFSTDDDNQRKNVYDNEKYDHLF